MYMNCKAFTKISFRREREPQKLRELKPQTQVRAQGGHQPVSDLGTALHLSESPTTGRKASTTCQSACLIPPYQVLKFVLDDQ